jgi:ribosomal protein S18 acetylase RimI-like enzyme
MHLNYEFVETRDQIRDGDAEGLDRLLRQLTAPPRELTRQDIQATIANAHLLVVRDLDAGAIVGTACLVHYVTLLRKHGRVEDVVVDERYRGHGIARKMVEMLLEKAKEIQADKVELTSNPSRKAANGLYKNIGFRQVETNVYRLSIAGPREKG